MRKFAQHVLVSEGVAPECELSVLLCDEKAISELNRAFLGRAGPTDVLAFAQDAVPRQDRISDEDVVLLGDVVICTDVASAQAEGRGVTFEEEILDLLAHGILHLVGYRDDTSPERRKMIGRQEELVRGFRRGEDTAVSR